MRGFFLSMFALLPRGLNCSCLLNIEMSRSDEIFIKQKTAMPLSRRDKTKQPFCPQRDRGLRLSIVL